MKERLDRRVLGAIRWVDAVTQTAVAQPLAVSSPTAALMRNRSGLSVILAAPGLRKYAGTFDLATLPPGDLVAEGSVEVTGEVRDPAGVYLPRAFAIKLPRDAAATLPRPAASIFTPIDLQLLPAPQVKTLAGWAQVRVAVTKKADAKPFQNVLVRVITKNGGATLGRGMSDARGEVLVAIAGLPLFREGLVPAEIVTSATAARIEFIPPGTDAAVVDWTVLDALAALPANVLTDPLALKAGGTFSLPSFAVSTGP